MSEPTKTKRKRPPRDLWVLWHPGKGAFRPASSLNGIQHEMAEHRLNHEPYEPCDAYIVHFREVRDE